MDWDNPSNYLVGGEVPTTFPDAVGDIFNISTGASNATIHKLNGDRTIVQFGESGIGMPVVNTFTVTNHGSAVLTLTDLTWDGPDAADFTLGAPASSSLAPTESTTFDVTFNPGTLGAKTATLHLSNSDSDEAPFDINLSGTGAVLVTYRWQGPDGGLWSTPENWNNTLPGAGNVAVFADSGAGASGDRAGCPGSGQVRASQNHDPVKPSIHQPPSPRRATAAGSGRRSGPGHQRTIPLRLCPNLGEFLPYRSLVSGGHVECIDLEGV